HCDPVSKPGRRADRGIGGIALDSDATARGRRRAAGSWPARRRNDAVADGRDFADAGSAEDSDVGRSRSSAGIGSGRAHRLNPLSAIYGGVVRARWLQGAVVSVGNLSAGGSGKTPFVLLLGELLKARAIKFDVLSRGYGR